ncbi:uncharacterized protein N7473_001695 [Penicillium subrubescens]|uniref:Uncharacterized protein n=1 Tax=Penicillium subrubescens TaxID=1316194 RepID=A0A1Q5TBW4_9EURO|nr:uncharacterized protein N7473_001695 [Penicillium subrubescens]KAJ5904779.1 hypothetical protein N7473_001695 [Penicillium subrubescens]OKO97716.1 hypothetical protein PENSUB_9896 [Penicillium subrubescens]
MHSRSATGWSEWEEDNLLPWLEENNGLPWTDRAQAYSKQFGVSRSVESLRGKEYHILRKRRLGRARRTRRTTTSKTCRKNRLLKITDDNTRGSLSSNDSIDRGMVGRWLQGIPEVAQNSAKSQALPSAKLSTCGMRRLLLLVRSNAYLLLQLMNYTHRTTSNKGVDQVPSFGTMYTGSVRKGSIDDAVGMLVSD